MLPSPLHPAIVHFPIVFVMLLPLFAIGALWAIHRGARPSRAWALPVAFAAALTLSAFVALKSGQAQEDKVEHVVGEGTLHQHEEAAERFLVLSGILLLVTGAGLVGGVVGRSARVVSAVGAVAMIVAGYQVGDSGGKLAYQHGAASVYAANATSGAPASGPAAERGTDAGD